MRKSLKIFGVKLFESEQVRSDVAPVPAEVIPESIAVETERPAMSAEVSYYNTWGPILQTLFNGEKNLGEMGPINKYIIDHESLRLRSWQLYLESEICQTIFKRFAIWVVGSGLKLQAEPQKEVLLTEGVEIDTEAFNTAVEARFKVYADSTISDYSSKKNLHEIADDAFINSRVGGDVLVILRIINFEVKVQLIDASHVATPLDLRNSGTDFLAANGNRVRSGIEFDANNQPVAYYVRSGDYGMEYERIAARGSKSGALMAFMVNGLKYRLDTPRSIPLISAVMETAKKMERYKEATLGSAEERQKIVYAVEHVLGGTGENPVLNAIAKASGFGNTDLPVTADGTQLANKVAATTNKQAFNLPPGSQLKTLESKNELYFKDFINTNIDLICATVGIPPSVAMSNFESNYSASRAAIKDWENTLNIERKKFADQFYQNVYNLWLDVQILKNKINAPGYIDALVSKNEMAISAYRYARWVGANVPHIDPLKEVQAERLKLGNGSGHLPLTTLEAATENLNGGSATVNMEQYALEMEKGEAFGIEKTVTALPDNTTEKKD